MKQLTLEGLQAQLDDYLTEHEIKTILVRRDKLVAHVEALGPAALYDLHPEVAASRLTGAFSAAVSTGPMAARRRPSPPTRERRSGRFERPRLPASTLDRSGDVGTGSRVPRCRTVTSSPWISSDERGPPYTAERPTSLRITLPPKRGSTTPGVTV